MSGDLDGRAVLVTGAASGIGRATALEVAGRGGSVLGLDRDADMLVETTNLVTAAGGSIEIVAGDVGDEDTVAEAVARAVDALRRAHGSVRLVRDISTHSETVTGKFQLTVSSCGT